MFRHTFAVAIILLGFWGIGIWTLAAGGFDQAPEVETAANNRPTVRLGDSTILSAHQDLSGRYTVFVRSPVRVSRI